MVDATRRQVLAAAGAGLVGGPGLAHADGYEREYELVADQRVDVTAVYIPFLGSKWGECVDHRPAAGQYDLTESADAVNRHVDQMQGFGVSTAMYNYNGVTAQDPQFHAFESADLAAELPVEPYYVPGHALKWNTDRNPREVLREDLAFVREELLSRERVGRLDGRPVVTLWDVDYLAWGGNETAATVKRSVLDEWGDFASLVAFLRDELTVSGTEPFLVADVHDNAVGGFPGDFAALNREFDGLTNWTGLLRPGETVPWREAYAHVEESYAATRAFADDHGQAYVPSVFPGFDDRHNDCWGHDRHVPRDPSHLRELLALADEYRTTDRVNLATFNGWPEGHQVEPGSFAGTDYGTAYLEVVKEYVQQTGTTTTTTTTTSTVSTTDTTASTATASTATTEHASTTTRETTTTGGQPGFGAAAAIAGVGAAAGLASRRATRDDG
jgi:PGF-CTERM protein